jgi:uncharacterized protein YbaR (Trm112 family)
MRVETLDILRCPYCGGALQIVDSVEHHRVGDEIHDAILACRCCWFPVVSGIPVMHLDNPVPAALARLEQGRADLARQAMFNLEPDQAGRFEEVVRSDTATYAEVVEALGPNYERGYFLYRFSDPSYVVAHALIRAVGGCVLGRGGRAIDLCGGSGHLTRALMDLSHPAPVLADLNFAKVWLGRRFTAPGCEAVCCRADAPLPFRRGVFRYAMCADAFMFIWTKRFLVQEMDRLVDDGSGRGTIVISHTHNQLEWSESQGDALPPDGYRGLFETMEPRLFSEAGLFADVVKGGPLDLSRRDPPDTVERDPALTIVAGRDPGVYQPYALDYRSGAPGELRLNPLYLVDEAGDRLHLRLSFPSREYEEEFGACREYLPRELEIDRRWLAALAEGRVPDEMAELVARRVVLDLPRRYY